MGRHEREGGAGVPGIEKRRVVSARKLAGERVAGPEGDRLGDIEEIMIDLPEGRVTFVVLSLAGDPAGEKLVAVPWDAFEPDPDNAGFILDIDSGRLKAAPGFERNDWPDFADPDWGTQIYNYYGYDPYWDL